MLRFIRDKNMQKQEILEIIKNAMNHYLKESLWRVSLDRHEQMKNMFNAHMEIIANYCFDNFINKSELTENFIKWLHKQLYPKDYVQYIKDNKWRNILYMKPWEYKTINNKIYNYILEKEIEFEKPELVKIKMNYLIENFNKSILINENKLDIILNFLLDFWKIHPFWDWNWRVITILIDLFLLKYDLNKINITNLKEKNMEWFYKSIQKSRLEKDLLAIKNFLTENNYVFRNN